ncbi:MAG TPA: AAA family ATPase, partial [Acidimicrobiales bacterium]|nr:AAA family ATPase [Acidimicrobiales bacterium]
MFARWPLVGRDAELAAVRRTLASARGPRGVAVFGEPGVGKTRLIAEVVEGCRRDGMAVEWVRATEAARRIPLGSFAHLLGPEAAAHNHDDLLHLALARLDARTGTGPFLLAVDDAHLLDDTSVALLHLVATQSSARLLVSVRTGEPLPAGLVALWKDELLTRLDIGPLGRAATEELVLQVVGEDVPASLLDRIWELSRGNALFVRELVTAAVERRASGAAGPVRLPEGHLARLRELVEERLRLLDPGPRAALEVFAVGEQVPLEVAERLAGADDLEELERRGLVEVVGSGAVVQVAHPLYGEVIADDLPRVRRRAILRDLVEAVGDLDTVDRLRVATWRLESGAPGDAEQLLALGREALGRLDHVLAERLALAAGGTACAEAGLVLAEALTGQGRPQEAAEVLAELQPDDPELVARVAMARASNLFLHLDRSAEAEAVLREADRDLAGHPAWQAECRSVLAQMLMFMMRLPEAGEIADQLVAAPGTPESARVRAVSVAVSV